MTFNLVCLSSRYTIMSHCCSVCLKQFHFLSKLQRHLLTHSGERAFVCSVCTKAFRQAAHLKAHSRCHWRPSGAFTYTAPQGPHGNSEKGFILKVRSEISQDVMSKSEDCSQSQTFWELMGSKRSTMKLNSLGPRDSEDDLQVINNTGSLVPLNTASRLQCGVCLKIFTAPSKLKRHLLIHSSQRPFVCRFCTKAFRQLAHLKVHMVTHLAQRSQIRPGPNDPPNEKKHPEVSAATTTCLPKSANTNILTKQCSVKLKRWNESAMTGAPLESLNYECPTCLKCFSAPSKLRRHSLVHTGQRPFQCPSCTRAFRQLSHLEAHYSVHTGAKKKSSLQQTYTGHTRLTRKFPRSVNQNQHKLTRVATENQTSDVSTRTEVVTGVRNRTHGYFCSVCSKGFSAPSKLKRHALIHTGQKPFRCPVCSRSFTQKANLKVHKCINKEKVTASEVQVLESSGEDDEELENNKKQQLEASRSSIPPVESKESSYKCTVCSKTFNFPSKLSRHLLIHTDIKRCHLHTSKNVSLETTILVLETPDRTPGRMVLDNQRELQMNMESRSLIQPQTEEQTSEITIPDKVMNATNPSPFQKSNSEVVSGSVCTLNPEPATPTPKVARKSGSFNVSDVGVTSAPVQTSNQSQTQANISANRCTFCLKTFDFPSKLSRHLLVHTGVRPHECHVCYKSFKQLSHLQCHRWVHSRTGNTTELPEEKLQSPEESISSINELDLHRGDNDHHHHHQDWIYNHNSEDLDPGVCRIKSDPILLHEEDPAVSDGTSRILESLDQDHQSSEEPVQTFSSHLYKDWTSSSHPDEQASAEIRSRTFICKDIVQTKRVQCKKSASVAQEMSSKLLHIDSSGKSFKAGDESGVNETEVPVQNQQEFEEHLQDIKGSSLETEAFGFHSYQHHPSWFETEDPDAPQHLPDVTEVTSDSSFCPSCAQAFRTLNELRVHRCPQLSPEETVRRSYQCAVCFKSFEAPSKLKRHYFIHTGQKPFQCRRCEKAFNQSNHLKTHMMSHRSLV